MNELLFAPSVVLPIVGGISSWLVSWAAGGVQWLTAAGIIAVLGGVGWMATRWIFKSEKIAQKALADELEKIRRAEDERVDLLMKHLRTDRDFRTNDYLTLLRASRDDFEKIAGEPGMQARSLQLVGQVRQLFWASIGQLEESFKLYELSERLISDERKEVLKRRERIMADVKASADQLSVAVDHFKGLANRDQSVSLESIRDELDFSLQAAKKAEERMRELEQSLDYQRHLRD